MAKDSDWEEVPYTEADELTSSISEVKSDEELGKDLSKRFPSSTKPDLILPTAQQKAFEDVTKVHTPIEAMAEGAGTLLTAGAGAAQGLTQFDLLDELLGTLPGTSQEEVNQALGKLEQDRPIAYNVGKFGGMVLPMALNPTQVSRLPLVGRAAGAIAKGVQTMARPLSVGAEALMGAEAAGSFIPRTLASAGDIASTSALMAAGSADQDRLGAAKEALTSPWQLGLQAANIPLQASSSLANVGGKALKESSIGKYFQLGQELTKEMGGTPASSSAGRLQLSAMLDNLSGEISNSIASGSKTASTKAQQGLNDVAAQLRGMLGTAKDKYGKEIESTLQKALKSKDPIEINSLVDEISGLMEARFQLVPSEQPAAAKVTELMKNLQVAMPEQELQKATTSRVVKNLETGAELFSPPTTKVTSKTGTPSDIEALMPQVQSSSPAGASVSTRQGPASLATTTTEKEILAIPAQIKSTATPQELFEIRSTLKNKLDATSDPNLASAYKTSLDAVDKRLLGQEGVESLLKSNTGYAKMKAIEEKAAKDYSKTEVTPEFLDFMANASDLNKSAGQTARVSSFEQLLGDVASPSQARALMEDTAKAASEYKTIESMKGSFLPDQKDILKGEAPKIKNVLGEIAPFDLGLKSSDRTKELEKTIQYLTPENTPEILKKVEKGALISKALEKTQPVDISTSAGGTGGIVSRFAQAAVGGLTGGLPIAAGSYVQAGRQALASKATDIVKTFSMMDNAQAQSLAERAMSKGYKALAALVNSSIGTNQIARNAAAFVMSQDPSLKSQMAEISSEDDGFEIIEE